MPDRFPPDEPVSPEHKGRILVIDDEAEIRESLETLLELEGYSVELGPNATEGLRKAEAGNYDLILLDLMMPDVSGIEVCQHVRADRRLKEILVIVFTAAEMKEEELTAAGADRFITKPYSLEGLRRVVRTLIKESAGSRAK